MVAAVLAGVSLGQCSHYQTIRHLSIPTGFAVDSNEGFGVGVNVDLVTKKALKPKTGERILSETVYI
jgi:hypothetical protein